MRLRFFFRIAKRSISLLPQVLVKKFEKLIYSSVYGHLKTYGLLSSKLAGFRPGDATVNQLLVIKHDIFKSFDCNPVLDVR